MIENDANKNNEEKFTNELIKILIVEDSVDDYELILRVINRSGLNAETKRVESPTELRDALKDNKDWNLIISDYSLPGFNAIEALRITKEINPHIPFILVSGTVGEETAVEAMKMGADDFILKDNIIDNHESRFIPAIKREIVDYRNQLKMLKTKSLLDKSRLYYQLLAQNVQDLVCIHDTTGEFSWVSPSSIKVLGYSQEELLSCSYFSLIHPDDVNRVKDLVFKHIQSGAIVELQRFKYKIKRKDQNYIHLETLAEPIYMHGELHNIVSTSRDITEQIQAYKLLEENQAKYESVLESMTEGVALVDSEEKILNANKSAKHFLKIEELDQITFSKLIFNNFAVFDSENNPLQRSDFFTVKEDINEKTQFNFIYKLKNGSKHKWLIFNSAPYSIHEEKLGAVISFRDVTSSYESEKKLNRLAQELVQLIKTANAPIFGIDKDGKITEWNDFAQNITGYAKKEVLGKNLFEKFVMVNEQEKVRDFISFIIEDGITSNCELSLKTKSGEIVIFLFSGNTRIDFETGDVGIICVGQDITELIEYRNHLEYRVEERTRDLKAALEKEKELVLMQTKFVSMASHEFRTPLSSIKFAADYIKNYYLKIDWEKVNVKLENIIEQADHMTHLLDDILEIGKDKAGKIKVEKSVFNLKEHCEKLIIEVQNQSKNSHVVDFKFSSTKEEVYLDNKLIRNIINNLLNNAIKFSPERDVVKLDVSINNDLIIIIVEDKGIGIPENELGNIYNEFYRSKNATSIQGTGLGLSIIKKAVNLLKGTIELESKIEKGTKFKVTLPLKE
ncbi:PAS domain S-box protein [Fulvivirga lutea]|uniref:histidine kinase n=1 Tax=Fulvivirga lutea TaxID=2810512 RepID=A0A974WHU3_9BACT|nr:PAS domain S-box protein [Fulvivirga lutea]QSE98818.1 PAS domain S-box protein [Fulvivirga lutea]